MPKNKGKGGKNRRKGKTESVVKRELIYKEDGQDYAQVTKMLGNGRVEAVFPDGAMRQCHIRGKMRKKVWIQVGDIVTVGLRDFQDSKADIILKYNADEAKQLQAEKAIPATMKINENTFDEEEGDDYGISFSSNTGGSSAGKRQDEEGDDSSEEEEETFTGTLDDL